jgi:hypothetical protein
MPPQSWPGFHFAFDPKALDADGLSDNGSLSSSLTKQGKLSVWPLPLYVHRVLFGLRFRDSQILASRRGGHFRAVLLHEVLVYGNFATWGLAMLDKSVDYADMLDCVGLHAPGLHLYYRGWPTLDCMLTMYLQK